jgi:hypothetical protein
VPQLARAAEYAEQNPTASVREIAEQTGVGHGTAQEAKAGVRTDRTPSVTVGQDGKIYAAIKPPAMKHRAPEQPADLLTEAHLALGPVIEVVRRMASGEKARFRQKAVERINDPDVVFF